MSEEQSYDILLVEDNEADVALLKVLLAECGVSHRLHVARDGSVGWDFVTKRGLYAACPTPDLILLDLNLPARGGRELLVDLKGHPELRRIPVIVLTTSESEREIDEAYSLMANAFVTKPLDIDVFENLVRSLVGFWLGHASLPGRPKRRL